MPKRAGSGHQWVAAIGGLLVGLAAILTVVIGPGQSRQVQPRPSPSPSPASADSLVVRHSNKCLDVEGASTADGAPVMQSTCQGKASQQWRLLLLGNGYSEIRAGQSDKCLDVAEASTDDGALVILFPCEGSANQQWK